MNTTGEASSFLGGALRRALRAEDVAPFVPLGLWLGNGTSALEVVAVTASAMPATSQLLAAWKSRQRGRPAPVLLVCLQGGKAHLCGPTGEQPPVHTGIDVGQAERLALAALAEPDRNAAIRVLVDALPSLETALPGVGNSGLLARHELAEGVPRRSDWQTALDRSRPLLARTDHDLLNGLGFSLERQDALTSVMRARDRKTALAVLLQSGESPDTGAARFQGLSPISYALAVADRENLRWVVMVQGRRIRLYPTEIGIGVGKRGRAETWVEVRTDLLRDDQAAFLWLLFSADALADKGTLAQIIEESGRFAGSLAESLRDRIYVLVVPKLARAVAEARRLRSPSAEDLALTYEMALTILFRLLFVAYAEDRDLLPYLQNEAYRSRSLKHKARELLDRPQGTVAAPGDAAWRECVGLFQAVDRGNPGWGVPPYNGGLFSSDKAISRAGFELAKLSLADSAFEPALADLLTIESAEGQKGPVDFRSLGVREFGTIYEGLLESELSVAEADLKLDSNGVYVPARGARDVRHIVVREGEIYLHDKSGARKGSGSYFTKDFIVDYLLDRALEPALTDHLARLDQLPDDTERARSFFDFRVADIAMGSGHFLVAAVDRIERRLLTYLKDRPLPGVRRELDHLRTAARTALGPLADATTIEDGQLLRRLIARRCIYGVDFNPLSVRLAQLAVWIHTFVPGLPLSLLDHSLVHGNSLIGVATVDDIGEVFRQAGVGMFAVDAGNLLGDAKQPLQKLATIADATRRDIEAARNAMEQARVSILPTAALCDIITARPIAEDKAREDVNRFDFKEWTRLKATVQSSRAHHAAKAALGGLAALHFPIAFPEVFLRRRPGFDVILGNPPWEEATVERHAFWARHLPGLRGMVSSAREREIARLERQRPDLKALLDREIDEAARVRNALMGGGYPGMGKGDPDLYKAFCWRFLALVAAESGRIGVVLPRSALSAFGSGEFRKSLFGKSQNIDITTVLNRGGWVFDEAEHRYTIGLVAIERGKPDGKSIGLKGPYASRGAFVAASSDAGHRLSRSEVQDWNDSASLPLLPTAASLDVFLQLRKSPRLDLNDKSSWRARPDRELDATNQKYLMDLKSDTCPKGFWPVFKGESFDLWTPDSGEYYAFAEPKTVESWLYEKRLKGGKLVKSAHAEFTDAYRRDRKTLACHRPRIAFRDVTRATDTRTVRAALLPANVFIGNQAPYLLWPRGDEKDEAFLLGVLSSRCLDWYARRFVETHVNYFVFNPFPVPRPARTSKLWQRVLELSGRLASPDDRFTGWAGKVGVGHGPLADEDKADMIHELEAVVACLYGLTGKQLTHIFETFHEGWDFEPDLRATLQHFGAWKQRTP